MKKITLNNGKSLLFFQNQDIFYIFNKVKEHKTQIVLLNNVPTSIEIIRPFTELIAGNIDSLYNKPSELKNIDIVFCYDFYKVLELRNSGITSYYQAEYFDKEMLFSFDKKQQRNIPISIIGNLDTRTDGYKKFFENISDNIPIKLWGNLASLSSSTVNKIYQGKISKNEHISIFSRSQITINPSIDNNFNKRLFESTGCGALLISEYKDYLNSLFDIGKEIIVYRTPEECIDLIKYYLNHPDEAQIIAKAGQKRTLKDHTFDIRMKKTSEILERHLRYRKEKNRIPCPQNISHSFKSIQNDQIEQRHTKSWQDKSIPIKQRGLVQKELNQMYQGKPPIVFQAMTAAMYPNIKPDSSVLEIGCSTGYYYEILEYLLNMQINYTGGDYSLPMIQMAKDYYPHVPFHVFDGAFLPYSDQSFTIVISSCVLLHTPNYQEQIIETARIAKDYIIAHRTPICRKKPTSFFTKYAYDVETVELIFNENEFISEFQKNGFEFRNFIVISENTNIDNYNITYIFKRKQSMLPTNSMELNTLQDSIYKEMTEKPEQIWKRINEGIQYYNTTSFKW